ncbi:TIGR01620 family protein [Methylobacterium sp. WL6]|uniref:YcjF family protein n=1 Tax=Methylobacterium sp. WL6 TaxID=2603901 RepID=UPI0011C7C583|nr:TIGR01620 family protein [Methylobacterium sp. WL6]TXN73182.1 TIGR01620 family protein [Methylobacterium sp. WL6]
MSSTQRPRAFRISSADAPPAVEGIPSMPPAPTGVRIVEDPVEILDAADGTPVPVAKSRGVPWGGLLLSAAGGLVSLGVGLSVERLIADLFQAAPWLGGVALALLALAGLALLAIVVREVRGLWRERKIEHLRQAAVTAIATRDHSAAQGVVRDLAAFYADRTALAAGRQRLEASADAILDVDDRIGLAEHELLSPLDRQARNAIATAAKQVSGVTALSPRAIVDVAFVIYSAVRLLRRIAAIYGGRPGFLGLLRLARAAFAHLTVTGGMAVGESMIQQVLGLGIAARVSAKLGEGVLNGLMTARFGLAALAVCRPLPFVREAPPRLSDVAGELLRPAEPEPKP